MINCRIGGKIGFWFSDVLNERKILQRNLLSQNAAFLEFQLYKITYHLYMLNFAKPLNTILLWKAKL